MTRPQPWHDEARRLRAAGLTYVEMSEQLGLSETALCKLFNPGYAERQADNARRAHNRRYRNDPAFRAKRQAYYRERRAKLKEKHS